MLSGTKKRVSKRNKRSWRKNIDVRDVDDFLEEKLRDERIGSLEDKKDEDLFIIDTKPDKSQLSLNKKAKAFEPLKCFQNLIPSSAVSDPIKRNRVRTKEERKNAIRKRIDEMKKLKGILSKTEIMARKQRELAIKKKIQKPKELTFEKDTWAENEKGGIEYTEWMCDDTVRHTLTNTRNLKIKPPKGILKKKSVLPTIEAPHPGMSYNPSYQDHQELLKIVSEREMKLQKEEAHIRRVTTAVFSKVTPKEKEEAWLKEMSQGLVKEEKEDEETPLDNEYKAINPPTSFEKKKTLKQRRKQREEKKARLLRKEMKTEKRKVADIYKLKMLNTKIEETEKQQDVVREKKKVKLAAKEAEPKRLGLKKFVEPDLEFTRGCDLKGSLRSSRPEGSLLSDRFYSLQKRNLLVPSDKVTRFKKAKTKRFVKASHRVDVPTDNIKRKRK